MELLGFLPEIFMIVRTNIDITANKDTLRGGKVGKRKRGKAKKRKSIGN